MNAIVQTCAGVFGICFSMWLFVTREQRARKLRERLQGLPRRLGETDARNVTPAGVAGIAVVWLLISAWILVEGVRGLF